MTRAIFPFSVAVPRIFRGMSARVCVAVALDWSSTKQLKNFWRLLLNTASFGSVPSTQATTTKKRIIFSNMVQSLYSVPHATYTESTLFRAKESVQKKSKNDSHQNQRAQNFEATDIMPMTI